jgi:pimeloyl-ACP methyl ester carboxylesterase
MNQYIALSIVIVLISLAPNVFSQTETYPFEVKQAGKGHQSIIFIPGLACSGEVWNDTRSLFENDYTCYTLTMAGFAGVPPQSHPTLINWERALAAFIEHAKIEKPVIIGHSLGGGLAMALAAHYPELVSKIIVVDALPCLSALMNPSFKAKEDPDCGGATSQFTSLTDEQFYQMQKQSIPRLVADQSRQELVVGWSIHSDRTTIGEMYCDYSNTDLRDTIGTIACPALVLLESYFVNFKPAIDEQFKHLKTATVHYAGKGLHFIMYDDKEWFTAQVISFIKQ